MPMTMMKIGKMVMCVREWFVDMRVRMRFRPLAVIMVVLMVYIVTVQMGMR